MQLFVLKKSSQVFFVSEYMSSYVIDALNDRSIKNKFFQLGPIIEEIKIKNHFAKVSRINGVVIRRLVKRTGVLDLIEKLQTNKLSLDIDVIGSGNQIDRIKSLSKSSISKVSVRGSIDDF